MSKNVFEMRLQTRIKEPDFTLCDQFLFSEKCGCLDLAEKPSTFESQEYGSLIESTTTTSQFLIRFLQLDLVKPVTFEICTTKPIIQLIFLMERFDNQMKHQIREIKEGTSVCPISLNASTAECLAVSMTEKHFCSFLETINWDKKEAFSVMQASRTTNGLAEQCLSTSPEILNAIRAICTCDRKGSFKRLYMEAKVTELLLLQLEQYQKSATLGVKFSKTDIEKMYEARSLIIKNLTTPCSLIDLAKRVGTNEFKLKKQFKALFGTTVFGYLNEIKMNKAKQILQEGNLNVTEVAEQLGYKTSSHFVTAFKRYFGYSPGSVLKVFSAMLLYIVEVIGNFTAEDIVLITLS